MSPPAVFRRGSFFEGAGAVFLGGADFPGFLENLEILENLENLENPEIPEIPEKPAATHPAQSRPNCLLPLAKLQHTTKKATAEPKK